MNNTSESEMDGSSSLDRILGDYMMRRDRGEQVDREELIARHPEFADELRNYFEDEDGFADMAGLDSTQDEPAFGRVAMPGVIRYFGDYELLEEIGHGGMGVVYKARQSSLNRTVAVKMILAGQLARPELVERFYREAKSAAQLTHRHIVAVHEVGEHDGHHFFSMDYVEGRSLQEVVHDDPLPPKRAAGYLRQVAEVIDYAHQQGVLHRDLKPANILIDRNDEPLVTDFGLARSLVADSDLTASSALLGTPAYMSPEQADPKREELGPWTDVYGIGATLYALLTGRPPFRAASQYAVVDQVLHTEPVAPRLLTPTVDRDIDTICMKCLEKSPQRRYQSARELADELRRFEEGKPIQARPISRLERSMRWCRRNRLAAAFIAVLGLVTLLLAVGGPIVAFRERDRAIRETQLRQDRDIARQDADENLGRQSLTAARTAMQRGRWDEARTALSTARDFYHDTVEVDVERIRVLQALGDVVESARESQRLLAQDPPDPWRATINLLHGDVLLLQNEPDEALEFIQRALDAEAGLDEAQRAYALALLASTPDAAIQQLREALHLDPFYYKARTQLVASLLMRGKRQEARDELVKALAMYPEDPNFAVFQAMLEAIEGNAADGMASVLSADEQFAANQKAAIYAAIEVCGRLAKLMDTWREGEDYEASQELLFDALLRLRGNAGEAEEHDVHSRFQYVVVRLPPAFEKQNDDVRRVLQLTSLAQPSNKFMSDLRALAEKYGQGELWFILGQLHFLAQDFAKAEETLEQCTRAPAVLPNLDREAWLCAMMNAGIRWKEGDEHSQRAAEHARKRMEFGPPRPPDDDYIWKVATRAGDYALALEIAALSAQREPDSAVWNARRIWSETKAASAEILPNIASLQAALRTAAESAPQLEQPDDLQTELGEFETSLSRYLDRIDEYTSKLPEAPASSRSE